MTVSGDWRTPAEAEARAAYYRSRGYRVTVLEFKSERAGSFLILDCQPRENT